MPAPHIYLVVQGALTKGLQKIEPPPHGILYIGRTLKDAGYNVKLFHLQKNRASTLMKAINEQKPLFVGFSNFISPLLKHDIEISRMLNEQGVKVVWGGVFSSTLPRVPLESGYVDYVVVGEGEKPIVELARAIEEGEEPKGIPGVGYGSGEEIVINPALSVEPDLDRYRFGFELLDWEKYIIVSDDKKVRQARIPFSRGCPFRCAFCYNLTDPGRQQWRAHSLDYLKEITDFLKTNYNVNLFHIMCDNPFGKKAEAQKLLEGLEINWRSPAHLSVINSEFIDWAKSAGCVELGVGVETGSDRMLALINKGITVQSVKETFALCRDQGLMTNSAWMAFMPGETPQDLRQTFELMDEIYESSPRHYMGFGIFRAYPGTEFWEASVRMGHRVPKTLEQWGDYNPQINHLLGCSATRARRITLLAGALYTKPRHRNTRIPSFARPYLRKRFLSGRVPGPFEELAYAGWEGLKMIGRTG